MNVWTRRAHDSYGGGRAGAPAPAPVAIPSRDNSFRGGYGPTVSNIINNITGLGGPADRSTGLQFQDIFLSAPRLETIYRVSWAAAKAIDAPVDDMWTPGRIWTGRNEAAIEAMRMAEAELDVHQQLTGAMKAGQLFGTALLIIVERNRGLEEPLDLEAIEPGGIANLLVTSRFNAGIRSWVIDVHMPRYGRPYLYDYSPRVSHSPRYLVHHSRVLRFDGIAATETEGWQTQERDWGFSRLTRAINQIAREESAQVSANQLLDEASIQVVKMHGIKQAIRGRPDMDDPTLAELGEAANLNKSLFRIMFVDGEDDTARLTVNFSGIPDLLEKKQKRLAAIFDIPVTRFLGESPRGLNATGESDARNYATRLESQRERYQSRSGRILDMAVARHAGLPEPPESDWLPILQIAPEVRAEVAAKQVQAIEKIYLAGLLTEEEARGRLSYVEDWFGELPIDALDFLRDDPPEGDGDGPPA